jgi:hypothetical protein
MNTEYRPPILEPVTPVDEYGDPDDQRDELAEKTGLPAHEIDEDRTSGGGLMSEGGTSIDRGTGTLGGVAQDNDGPVKRDLDDQFDETDV